MTRLADTVGCGPALANALWLSAHRAPPALLRRLTQSEIFEPGIQAIDVLTPLAHGGEAGLFGGADVGKPVLLTKMVHKLMGHQEGVGIFCGIGEHLREGEQLHREMQAAGVLPNMVTTFAQTNKPPSARFRVGHAVLMTTGCCCDDRRCDLLLLADTIFRFIQAGSEVLGLMGQMPSRLRYQPTMGTGLACLQKRIAHTGSGAITAMQAVRMPADDFTDLAAEHMCWHLSAFVVLSRQRPSKGLSSAIDPLRSSSKMVAPGTVGQRHPAPAQAIRRTLARDTELKDTIATAGALSHPAHLYHRAVRQPGWQVGALGGCAGRLRAHPRQRIQGPACECAPNGWCGGTRPMPRQKRWANQARSAAGQGGRACRRWRLGCCCRSRFLRSKQRWHALWSILGKACLLCCRSR